MALLRGGAPSRRFRFITSYSFNTANADASQGLAPATFEQATFETYHLALGRPYAEVVAGYTAKRRSTLSQARRQPLVVEPGTDIELLIQLFKANTVAKMPGGVGEKAYRMLRRLYTNGSAHGIGAAASFAPGARQRCRLAGRKHYQRGRCWAE